MPAPESEPLPVPVLPPVVPPCLRGIDVVGGVIVGAFVAGAVVGVVGLLVTVRAGGDVAEVTGGVSIWPVTTGSDCADVIGGVGVMVVLCVGGAGDDADTVD